MMSWRELRGRCWFVTRRRKLLAFDEFVERLEDAWCAAAELDAGDVTDEIDTLVAQIGEFVEDCRPGLMARFEERYR